MGVKGLYNIIGKGRHVPLAKLAVDHLQSKGRPLRLAIDFSIWHFQIQSGQGGTNPAVRTLYFRLLKLLGSCVQPLFVFDGPQRPAFKRDKALNRYYTPKDVKIIERLLRCFGFPFHRAPGEAEAECAMLQKHGIVDAVLTEDVDVLMFGCTSSLRNWTVEKAKTSVFLEEYAAKEVQQEHELDTAGMILIALMSGGDYDTSALVRCGHKTAYEAAKAGFGRDLLQVYRNPSELTEWRDRLRTELQTNENSYFRQRHPAIIIPDSFPNVTTLEYYASPIVSHPTAISGLNIDWSRKVDVPALRRFVAEIFAWSNLKGAHFFMKGLAAPLLAQKLYGRSLELQQPNASGSSEDIVLRQAAELELIEAVTLRRTHESMNGCSELRITMLPSKIVGIDLSEEEQTIPNVSQTVSPYDAGGAQADMEGGDSEDITESTQGKNTSVYDPTQPERAWLPETFVQIGTPLLAENWENDLKELRAFAVRKARPRLQRSQPARARQRAQQGVIDRYVRITKAPGTSDQDVELLDDAPKETRVADRHVSPSKTTRSLQKTTVQVNFQQPRPPIHKASSTPSTPRKKSLSDFQLDLRQRPLETYGFKAEARYSALGIYPDEGDETSELSIGIESPNSKEPQSHNMIPSLDPADDVERLSFAPRFTNVTLRTPRAPRPRQGLRRAQTELEIGAGITQPSRSTADEVIDLCGTPPSAHEPGGGLKDLPSSSISIDLTGDAPDPQSAKKSKLRRLFALRQSLEGAWRYAEPEETRLAKEILEGVDIVDLTEV